MAKDDWEPDAADQEWLPGFDVRTVVAGVPAGPVGLDDPVWNTLRDNGQLPSDTYKAIQDLYDADSAGMERALVRLRWMIGSDGNTRAVSALVVPTLIRLGCDSASRSRVDALQLVGDLARVDTLRAEVRPCMLRIMQPMPVYDPCGYLENWSVAAVRMSVGRDVDLLHLLLDDADPHVRGRAAYVLVTADPVGRDLIETLRLRLAAEIDASVRATLVICIASLYREFVLVSEALDWAWDIWSDPASPVELRFGAAVAWLNLTDQVMPPELRRLLDELPAPTVYELAQQLPWISWRRHVSNGIELWWEVLTR